MPIKTPIKIIHLPARIDRLRECDEELKKIKIEESDGLYFCAKETMNLGGRGCALSHAMALSEFLFDGDQQFILILEDDFKIMDLENFWEIISNVINHENLWDVYLLGHKTAVAIESTPLKNTFRGIHSQTTSGYIVKRDFAPKLIEIFFRSAELLKKYQHLPSPNREIATHLFFLDQLWGELQIKDRFWFSIPALITQRPSFSDILKKNVNYGI